MAYPPAKKLIALLKDANVWFDDYQDIINNINQQCELCKVYAKTPPRPIVGLAMGNQFHEKIYIDGFDEM